jgi:DNA-binding NarL/FixJ family response regulator
LGPVRILIVDDFEHWRNAVRSILAGDSRIEVVGECSDGACAVQKTEELQPDLVLLDIQLPEINGFIAAQRIAKVAPNTKVLFLSTHGSLDMLREALSIGAGLVVKTDAARDLLPVIWAVVQNEPIARFKILNDESPDSYKM